MKSLDKSQIVDKAITKYFVHSTVHETAVQVLGTFLATDAELISSGFDSIMGLEFITSLSQQLSLELSPVELFDHPSIDSVIDFLLLK